MKLGQTSVKELADFVKEAALIEDEYQKHLMKIIKQLSNYGQVGYVKTIKIEELYSASFVYVYFIGLFPRFGQ